MQKLKRFVRYYKPHKGLFILDMSCALAMALVDLAFPMVTRRVLQELLPAMQQDSALLKTFVLLMLAIFAAYVLRTFMTFIVSFWGHRLGVLMEADMRRDIFTHIESLPFRFYDGVRTGKLLSRVTNDLFEVTELAHHGPEDLFISLVTIAGAFVFMFRLEWRLALALLIIMVPAVAFVMCIRVKMRMASKEVKATTAEINAGIESAISGIRVAKAFTNEAYELQKFEKGNGRFINAKRQQYFYMAIFQSGTDFFTALFNVATLAVGGVLIWKQSMDPLLMVTFTLYVSAFLSPIKRLAAFAEQYVTGMAGFTRFCEVMDVQPDITDLPDAKPLVNKGGAIDYNDVSFRYEAGQEVLEHVTLHVPAGTTLGLVGPSGGGKTTLCHLLPRFYEPQSGTVCLDGQDVRRVTLQSLRRSVGIVQQDVFLFADTVMENIRYGRTDATDEEVMEAAKRAHIHHEILQFPRGYQTQVGERGIMLSGGQKQRISIARLFLKDPPVLILDEATSALDSVTEAGIRQAFEELSRGRTTLIIAHRLSTVRSADSIAVIDGHGIREQGTHEQLMALGGMYAGLCRASQETD